MERAVAVKKLGKILGKSLGYRIDAKAPSQSDRDEARSKLPDATARRKALSEQLEARKVEILQADARYQQLKSDHTQANKVCNDLLSRIRHYRFTVGTSSGMFFVVKAQGDSWEDVIAKLTTGSQKQAALDALNEG